MHAGHWVLRYAAEPELEREPDILLLMKEHDLLAQLLLNQSEAERTSSPMEHARLLSALAAREADLEHEVQERTQALLAAEDALRQSQKMEAVGQLTGGLARDFNNMLTGIIGNLELLQRRIAQGRISEIERYIVAAQNAAQRAATLTHRLLGVRTKAAPRYEVERHKSGRARHGRDAAPNTRRAGGTAFAIIPSCDTIRGARITAVA